MNIKYILLFAAIAFAISKPGNLIASTGEFTGYIATEMRLFPESPASSQQGDGQVSLSIQPEYFKDWDEGKQSFTFVPYIRLDSMDSQRTHWDIRELTWVKVGENWEVRAGLRKLFWGVAESQHLVDVINQTDLVDSLDGEEKLGQPMVNVSFMGDNGTLDLFLLPYFRERTFPGEKARLRTGLYIDTDQAQYESGAEKEHIDWAVRWFQSLGDWDVGLSHFSGTSRSPTFNMGTDSDGNSVLVPYYALMEQTGIDLQATKGAWLWKLEAITQRSQGDRHQALTGGFEYTFVGVFDSAADMGLISEYLYDDRGESAPTPMESDLMVGMRLALNDEASTDFLVGASIDVNQQNFNVSLEGSRRIKEDWKLSIEGRIFIDPPKEDPIYSMRRDSFVQLELARYF
ncbi:MAG: hypothetical protein HQL69_03685 [Magnetococcales bacterium]|nr:hypothetical protein [Magnetococcales bacterium]